MKTEKLMPETLALLNKPLPKEAISQHPTKKFLSTIKVPYIIERLNEAFGVNGWHQKTSMVERVGKMVVVQSWLKVPDLGIELEAYGGNDNDDLGDAYKGAQTDALSKMASFIGIGADVYKGLKDDKNEPNPKNEEPELPWLNENSKQLEGTIEKIRSTNIEVSEIKKHFKLSKKVLAILELEIILRNKK